MPVLSTAHQARTLICRACPDDPFRPGRSNKSLQLTTLLALALQSKARANPSAGRRSGSLWKGYWSERRPASGTGWQLSSRVRSPNARKDPACCRSFIQVRTKTSALLHRPGNMPSALRCSGRSTRRRWFRFRVDSVCQVGWNGQATRVVQRGDTSTATRPSHARVSNASTRRRASGLALVSVRLVKLNGTVRRQGVV
jgi:hypothetical protein